MKQRRSAPTAPPSFENSARVANPDLANLDVSVLDGRVLRCQSRAVKSCGPSGSRDLAFKEIDLLLLREGTSRNGRQPTADALLTMEVSAAAMRRRKCA
jgi:hypothetical protein